MPLRCHAPNSLPACVRRRGGGTVQCTTIHQEKLRIGNRRRRYGRERGQWTGHRARIRRMRAGCRLLARGCRSAGDGGERDRRGQRGLAVPTDVSDADAVERAADAVERDLGPIDIWVNDAMVTVFSPVSEITPDEFRRATEVTYLGYRVRHDGGAAADAAARPRHDRAGRLGAGLPRHPAAVGLLRRQVRDPRLHRLAAHAS